MKKRNKIINIIILVLVLSALAFALFSKTLIFNGKAIFSFDSSIKGIEKTILEVNRDIGEYKLLFVISKDQIIGYPDERSFIAYWIYVNGEIIDAKAEENNQVYKIFSGNIGKIYSEDKITVKAYFNTDLNGAKDIVYTGYNNTNEGTYKDFPLVLRSIENSQINYMLYAYDQGIKTGMINPIGDVCGLAWGYCTTNWGGFDMKKIEPFKPNIFIKDKGEKINDQPILVYRFENNKCTLTPVLFKDIDPPKDFFLLLKCEKKMKKLN